jgi:hypothetical protein
MKLPRDFNSAGRDKRGTTIGSLQMRDRCARILNEGCRLLCEPDVRFDQTFFQVGSHAMGFSSGGSAYSLARNDREFVPEPQSLPRH